MVIRIFSIKRGFEIVSPLYVNDSTCFIFTTKMFQFVE